MANRGLGGTLLTAGIGALATLAGVYVAKKAQDFFKPKPKMKLFHRPLCLSTRCAWLISELDAEADFDMTDDIPAGIHSNFTSTELLMLQDSSLTDGDLSNPYPIVPYGDHEGEDASDEESHYPDSANNSPLAGRFAKPIMPAVVVNDEFTMIEGAAICLYLADLYGQFLPDEQYKAEYYSWIVYSAATFDNILKTLHEQLVKSSERGRDPVILDSATEGFHAFARALSESLDHREYICGDRFTAADCVLGFTLWWAFTIDKGQLLGEHPALVTYLDRLRARPAFQKTFGINVEDWDWGEYFSTYVRGVQPVMT